MNSTRKSLGAVAVALGSIGLLGACAPPPTPPTPPATGTSTKTVNLACTLDIFQGGAFLFSSPKTYNGAVLSLTAPSSVPTGTNAAYTATVSGITNGPLPMASGLGNVEVKTGAGAAINSSSKTLGTAAGNAPIVFPTMSGSSTAISATTTLSLSKVEFTASGAASGDGVVGVCNVIGGDQPSVSVAAS